MYDDLTCVDSSQLHPTPRRFVDSCSVNELVGATTRQPTLGSLAPNFTKSPLKAPCGRAGVFPCLGVRLLATVGLCPPSPPTKKNHPQSPYARQLSSDFLLQELPLERHSENTSTRIRKTDRRPVPPMSATGLTRRRGGRAGADDTNGTSSSPARNGGSIDIGRGPETGYADGANGHKIAYDPQDISETVERTRLPKLTLMEEVLLLGLKDKQVGFKQYCEGGMLRRGLGISVVLE